MLKTIGLSLFTFCYGVAGMARADTLLSLTDAPTATLSTYVYTVQATSTSEDLTFSFSQQPSYFDLTNISVSTNGAPNLIQNGSFQTGDFSNFAQYGNTTYMSVVTSDAGNYAQLGPYGFPGFLTQTISTDPGTMYTVSFDLGNEQGGYNTFDASFDETSISTVPLPPALPMFATAVLALVGFEWVRKRRLAYATS